MSTTNTIELQPLEKALTPIPNATRSKNSLEIPHSPGRILSSSHQDDNHELESFHPASAPENRSPSRLRIALTIGQPSLVNFFSSFTTGIITVALPVIAQSLSMPRSLYVWPSSVYGLTSGSMLLIAGSVADLVGPRNVELCGIFLLGIFTLAGGFATTGVQLVIFRALQGIALAMHLPASTALIASGVPEGRARNFGFACLGLSQPLGFSVGLVVSGIMVDRAGWRSAFYLSGGGLLLAAVAAIWMLPKVQPKRDGASEKGIWKLLYTEVDWIGGLLASGGLAMFAYVLAILSADLSAFHSPLTASLFSLSVVLLVAFPFWMHRREKAGKQALVPNSLWKNLAFSTTCVMVALSYGVMSSMELFSSLYFQEIQRKSTLTTSLYLLPNLVVGVALNLGIGLFVHRIQARWLVTVSSLLCSLAPCMMAIVNPTWRYWYLEFWAQVFAPMSADVLFTVGLIIVSNNFPQETQALAGAVFNTVAQFGQSFGVGLCQVVALGVMGTGDGGQQTDGGSQGGAFEGVDETAMLKGYRASFWTMFSCMVVCGLTALFGLRKIGKVGLKSE